MQPLSVVRRSRVGSLVLAVVLLATGTVLAAWKHKGSPPGGRRPSPNLSRR